MALNLRFNTRNKQETLEEISDKVFPHFYVNVAQEKNNMKKTIVITGSTDGIGKLTAKKLAKEGHTIYLHGRSAEKLSATITKIKEVSDNENVQGFIADFSNLKSAKKMAEEIKKKLSKIDVLINNAGIYNSKELQNQDGLDMRMLVNYLSPYKLTNEILPVLKKGTNTRIINLSSAAQASISEAVLKGNQSSTERQTYAQSKLALLMWSFYLAKKETELQVVAVNPGSLLNTKMVKQAFGEHWSSADKGANILYDLAVSEEYKNVSGKYFDNDKGAFSEAHQDAYKKDKIDSLIKTTNEILNH